MKRTLLVTLALLVWPIVALWAQTTIYVNGDIESSGNGTSWKTAYKSLDDALDFARANTNIKNIRVAEGTYKPSRIAGGEGVGKTARDNAFVIPAGVTLYGGFIAGRDFSDPEIDHTILSGDLDETSEPSDGDAYHVVIMPYAGSKVDGFIIEGGNANVEGSITVDGREFPRSSGGGVCVNFSDGDRVELKNSTITGNAATGDGGGVYVVSGSLSTNGNTITGNKATGFGGGIYTSVFLSLINNVIANNTAAEHGGGLYAAGNISLDKSTITGNTAATNGGVFVGGTIETLVQNILWGNTGANLIVGGSVGGTPTTNLIGDAAVPEVITAANGNLIGLTLNPLFVDADNGDCRLYPYSQAVLGVSLYMGAKPPLSYSMTPPKALYVDKNATLCGLTSSSPTDGTTWGKALNSLSAALWIAREHGRVDTIYVAQGTYKPQYRAGNGTTDRDRAFVIPAGVAVLGGYKASDGTRDIAAYETTLSGDIGEADEDEDNSYHVVLMPSGGARLEGFTVTAGNANGKGSTVVNEDLNIEQYMGGGIYASAEVSVVNNRITGNKASGGGGVFATGTASVVNNWIKDNKATDDGGGVFAFGTASVVNNWITGNEATTGGGVFAFGTASVVNNWITGNKATDGGGVYANETASLVNNTITDNQTGVYVHSSDVSLANNIIWGNGEEKYNLKVNLIDTTKLVVLTNNLIGDARLPEHTTDQNNLFGNNLDPLFAGNFSLQPESPCINRGSDEAYPLATGVSAAEATDFAGNPRFIGWAIDMGASEYQTVIDNGEKENTLYHSLTLTVAPGIELLGLAQGTHQIEADGHLYLQFLPQDRLLTAADVMLLIDGTDTKFNDPGTDGYFSHILSPITGDHTIVIAQRHYSVTLPEVPSAVLLTPSAGTHRVPYGQAFSFGIGLNALKALNDLDALSALSALKVYVNGTLLAADNNAEPGQAQWLQFTLDQVTGPVEITFEGLESLGEGTTGKGNLARGGIQLRIMNYELRIDNSGQAVDVSVYTVTGQRVAQVRALSGSRSLRLQPGVYLVKAGGMVYKVIVN